MLQQRKLKAQMASVVSSIKHLRKAQTQTNLTQTHSKNTPEENIFKLISWRQHNANTKIKQRYWGWGGKLQIILIKTDPRLLNKASVNESQQYIKRVLYHDQVGLVTATQGGLTFKNQAMYYYEYISLCICLHIQTYTHSLTFFTEVS